MVRRYADLGASSIRGIDISEVGIQQAIENYGHLAKVYAGDVHCMPFPDDCFDVIVGRSIIHHLKFEVALSEISRTLRPGGRAIFMEPLGDNPASKVFRRLTPRGALKMNHPFPGSRSRSVTIYSAVQSIGSLT
jgi:ubiquinone/menaquinone biosynthesis C-methylase UbiE